MDIKHVLRLLAIFLRLVWCELHFGLLLASCVCGQRRNSAILAQESPSRLSESCKSSFMVLVRMARSGGHFSVERHDLSLKRGWLA